jgi:hypothetical protein
MKPRAIKPAVLINAAAMAIEYPATFRRPSAEELAAIGPGSVVRIGIPGERFWGVLVERRGADGAMIGKINSPVYVGRLRYGDEIALTTDHIFEIYEGPIAATSLAAQLRTTRA